MKFSSILATVVSLGAVCSLTATAQAQSSTKTSMDDGHIRPDIVAGNVVAFTSVMPFELRWNRSSEDRQYSDRKAVATGDAVAGNPASGILSIFGTGVFALPLIGALFVRRARR